MTTFDDRVRAFLTHGSRTGKIAWVAGDGRPLVTPVWFLVDGDELVFTTGSTSAKGRAIQRDPRVTLVVDLDEPPYSMVQVQGEASVSEDPDEMLGWATALGERYMGADRAGEFGRRNAVPGELLVRIRPTKVIAHLDVTA